MFTWFDCWVQASNYDGIAYYRTIMLMLARLRARMPACLRGLCACMPVRVPLCAHAFVHACVRAGGRAGRRASGTF